jgi:selenocysteine-specific elongation factor
MAHIIIGTAGHIDHGKSSLVKALTGTDPDRLVEEQERGMTIDLGFAFLDENIAFIDVPGHERFIKNMVAGVSTVDMAMLVVAADDGVMPQTREHLDILSLLNLKRGLIVITKIDLVDAELLQLVEEDIHDLIADSFLQAAPMFRVSTKTGAGIDVLRNALISLANQAEPRPDHGALWMPVDRSFSIKGFGTVVTGSVLSGSVRAGELLDLLPAQKEVRVRGVQSHGQTVAEARLGDRAALNLANIAREEIQRGDVLATHGNFSPSSLFDAKLTLLKGAKKPLAHRSRIRLHVGTREILARVKLLDSDKIEPGNSALVQLQLEQPAVAMRRDPYVIRQYSPTITIGGGIILDTNPKPRRRFHKETLLYLQNMEKEDPREMLTSLLFGRQNSEISAEDLIKSSGLTSEFVHNILDQLEQLQEIIRLGSKSKPLFLYRLNYVRLQERLVEILQAFHSKEPLRPGMSKAELKGQITAGISQQLFELTLSALIKNGIVEEQPQWVKLTEHRIQLSPKDEETAKAIRQSLLEDKFNTPTEEEIAGRIGKPIAEVHRTIGAMQGLGEVLHLEGDIYFHSKAVEEAKARLFDWAKKNEEISVSQFRELLNTTRKYALALLLHFDQQRITERVEDVRIIKSP